MDQKEALVRAADLRVGDCIQMLTADGHPLTRRWGYVTKIDKTSSGRVLCFDGEAEDGVPLGTTLGANEYVERKGR